MKKMFNMNHIVKKVTPFIVAVTAAIVCTAPMGTLAAEDTPQQEELINEMLYLVNEAREEAGLKPLYSVSILNESAETRAEECAEYFGHSRTDSTLFNTVLDSNGIPYGVAGENIAAGSSTAEATFEQWKNSPSHWKNIMSESFTHIGVGVVYAPDTEYGWYWEQIFIGNDSEVEGQYVPEREVVTPTCCGDIDGDGSITSLDFVILVKYLKQEVVLNDLQISSADCLQDGVITVVDAIILRKFLLGEYSSPSFVL